MSNNRLKEALQPENMTKESLKAFINRYKDDPVLFVKEILGLIPDKNQIQILESVRDDDYISVSSGRGIGKSWTLSMVAAWIISTRQGAKVLVMSNTDSQSKSTLWSPLVSILKRSLIKDWFEYSTELINFKGDKESAFIKRLVWSENNIEAVSGYHSENMIFLCDEASKYPNAILDNLYASCTQSWNKMLLTSNPTRNTGYFYDTSFKDTWNFLEIDSRNSVHTDKDKIDELIETYGIDSDTVRVQVLGKFPRNSSESILNNAEADITFNSHYPVVKDNHVRVLGVDIGGGGDGTCFAIRAGQSIVDIVTKQTNTKDVILREIQTLVHKHQIDIITFDKTGMGHFLQTDIQNIVPKSVEVYGINFGDSSPEPDCFNKRSWLYRRFRDWVRQGGVVGDYAEVKIQALATETLHDDKGRLKLIPKEKIKKEIGKSPDELDAVVLTCGYRGDLLYKDVVNTIQDNQMTKLFMDASAWG